MIWTHSEESDASLEGFLERLIQAGCVSTWASIGTLELNASKALQSLRRVDLLQDAGPDLVLISVPTSAGDSPIMARFVVEAGIGGKETVTGAETLPGYSTIASGDRWRAAAMTSEWREEEEEVSSICFFTLVLNGEPFIRYHAEVLMELNCPWEWHVIEGVASHVEDTSWCAEGGGRIDAASQRDGLSVDGTSAYLTKLATTYPDRIHVHRRTDRFWNGKREMVQQPLKHRFAPCLLWEIDSDELWTAAQIETCLQLFRDHPDRRSALFWCHYFVGPEKVIVSRTGYARRFDYEWRRVWRFRPGMQWGSHEPPDLQVINPASGSATSSDSPAFSHAETLAKGLIFQHFSFASETQVRFKETYYGFKGAIEGWKRLQEHSMFPARLQRFLSWVDHDTIVDEASWVGVEPLAEIDGHGRWRFKRDRPATTHLRFWGDGIVGDILGSGGTARAIASIRLLTVLHFRLRAIATRWRDRLRPR